CEVITGCNDLLSEMKGLSIRSRIIRMTSLISAVSLVIVFTALLIYEVLAYRENTLREMNVLANVLAANSTAALAFDNDDVAQEILSAVRAERLITTAI